MNGNLHLIPGISLHVYFEDRTFPRSDEVLLFSHCANPELNILCFPRSVNGTHRLYQGLEALPDEYLRWLAKRILEPFYQRIVNDLWKEMHSAMEALGFSGA